MSSAFNQLQPARLAKLRISPQLSRPRHHRHQHHRGGRNGQLRSPEALPVAARPIPFFVLATQNPIEMEGIPAAEGPPRPLPAQAAGTLPRDRGAHRKHFQFQQKPIFVLAHPVHSSSFNCTYSHSSLARYDQDHVVQQFKSHPEPCTPHSSEIDCFGRHRAPLADSPPCRRASAPGPAAGWCRALCRVLWRSWCTAGRRSGATREKDFRYA